MAFNALRTIFSKTPGETGSDQRVTLTGPRIPRHSTGWSAMLKHLNSEESLQVLDVGPTSPSNINFLTGLGHSLYMADIVMEAHSRDWLRPPGGDDLPSEEDIHAFFEKNMDFGGRLFDVILLWTTLDYLPEALLAPMIERLHASLNARGLVLAFFHTKPTGPDSIFYRYHVTASDSVEMQQAERLAVHQVYTNRKIEKLFSAYQGCKFYLAKDNVYEVIVTR